MRKKSIIQLIFTLFCGVAMGAMVTFMILLIPSLKDTPQFDISQDKISEAIALKRVEEIAKIVTVEYQMSDIIDYTNEKIWPFRDQKVLVIAKAKIHAGFDLLKGKINIDIYNPQLPKHNEAQQNNSDYGKAKRKIVIKFPSPEIISIEPDYKYYDINGSVPIQIHNWLLARAKMTLKSAAVKAGILEVAKKSMKTHIEQIFWGYGFDEIDISFAENTIFDQDSIKEGIKN